MSETDASSDSRPSKSERPILEVEGLRKHFVQNDSFVDRVLGNSRTVQAVDGVDLSVGEEEIVGVVGESGCGKSTLAKLILNLERATSGSVRYKGDELTGVSDKRMREYRRDIQMIFQAPLGSLNPRRTVGEIIRTPLEVHDIGANEAERMDMVRDVIKKVGLDPNHLSRYPRQFSGGQQQRIAIARALILEPELLIADEPVSALDVSVQAQILSFLNEIQDDMGLSIIFIAHDLGVIRHIADRVYVMYLGKIVESGPTETLFNDPKHPYTRSLLSAIPRIDPKRQRDRVILRGTVPSPIDPPSGCRFNTRCPVVIPPPDWSGTQEEFTACFQFRDMVQNDDYEISLVQSEVDSDANMHDRLAEEYLPMSLEDLPAEAAEMITDALAAIVEGDESEAQSILAEAFPSPCETDVPRQSQVESGHATACHRYDPEKRRNHPRIESDLGFEELL